MSTVYQPYRAGPVENTSLLVNLVGVLLAASISSRTAVMQKSIYSRRQEILCEFLRQARKTAGLTQTALAKRLRRPQSFVAKYEQGQRRLDLFELTAITEALAADLETLVERVKCA